MVRYHFIGTTHTPKPPLRVRLRGRSSGFSLGEWDEGEKVRESLEKVGEVGEDEGSKREV